MTKRTGSSILLLTLLVSWAGTTPAVAADQVSAFSISGSSITGYTNESATGMVTIQRDPASTGAVPVVLGVSGSG